MGCFEGTVAHAASAMAQVVVSEVIRQNDNDIGGALNCGFFSSGRAVLPFHGSVRSDRIRKQKNVHGMLFEEPDSQRTSDQQDNQE